MNPWLALGLIAAACWNAWIDLAARLDAASAAPLLLVVGAIAVPAALRPSSVHDVSTAPLVALLSIYIGASVFAPPIFAMASALLAVCWCLHGTRGQGAPRAAFIGLALLALPIVPTLEFFGAYPVRLAAIEASAGLLRMNGLAVGVDGLALRFGDELIQFDAPCSGVHMLWACWFLASALAWLYRFGAWRYGLSLLIATALAIAGNVVRATSLFYVEAGLIDPGDVSWLHEGVGLVAFAMTAALLFGVLKPRSRAAAA